MALYVQTNVSSLFAQNTLAKTSNAMSTTFARLSSGYRINGAADDAAGLGISERMNAQVRSFAVAERNANDGISMAQTADSAAGQIGGLITRLRELAVQSSNGALVTADRNNLDTEKQSVLDEIDRIASVTRFNGKALLDGSQAAETGFQVGILNSAGDSISVDFTADLATDGDLGIDQISFSSQAAAKSAIAFLDSAMNTLNTQREVFGAGINRLQQAVSNLQAVRSRRNRSHSKRNSLQWESPSGWLASSRDRLSGWHSQQCGRFHIR